MKHSTCLIAGIDFSPCSLNALNYAADLAMAMHLPLVVLHAYRSTSRAGSLSSAERHIRQTVKEDIRRAIAPIQDRYPDLTIDEMIKRADPMEALLWAAKKYHAEHVVLGTQGTHESPDVFIGGTTGAMIKLGDAPVLAVPSGCTFSPIQRILFAVKNPFVASRQVIEPFLHLKEYFDARADLLHVTRDTMPDLSRFPNPYPIVPHIETLHTLDSDNIYHSVQQYLHDEKADLLVVISRLRGFFEGLFVHSSTSVTTFNSELPFLVLHGGIRE